MSLQDRMNDQAQYGHQVKNLCQSCARRTGYMTCEAFPEAIPMDILFGIFDHHHPYAFEGKDDLGLTYVPKTEGQS